MRCWRGRTGWEPRRVSARPTPVVSKRATPLAAVLTCLLSLMACVGHPKPATGTHPATEAPTPTPTGPSAGETSGESATLSATFSWNGGSFRYPADWHLSQFSVVSSFTLLIAVLSNQQVHDPCTRTPTRVSCGEPLSHLSPRGVLVTWTQPGIPGASIAQQPGTATTVNGRAARLLVADAPAAGCTSISGTTAEVDATVLLDSSNHMWQMRACIAGPNPHEAVETAVAIFGSARFDASVWK